MLVRIGYVFRELWYSLRRNPSLFFGTLITIAVSLTLLGVGLLVFRSVEQATERWQGDIEFIVFMNADASEAQNEAIVSILDNNNEVRKWDYYDQDRAFEEFLELFADNQTMRDSVTKEVLPPSYRVTPTNVAPDVVAGLADQFQTKPGVKKVVLATEVLRQLENISSKVQTVLLVSAAILGGAALLLVFNTIRTAIFAQRREIEVMRLVGASNWYIRFPFLVEGVLQGVFGGLVCLPALLALNSLAADFAGSDVEDPEAAAFTLLEAFVVDGGEVAQIGILMAIIGAVFGAIASMIAVSRYLDA